MHHSKTTQRPREGRKYFHLGLRRASEKGSAAALLDGQAENIHQRALLQPSGAQRSASTRSLVARENPWPESGAGGGDARVGSVISRFLSSLIGMGGLAFLELEVAPASSHQLTVIA